MKTSSPYPPIRPWVVKLSLTTAIVAWVALAACYFFTAPEEPSGRFGIAVVAIGWPIIYLLALIGAGVAAEIALRTELADLYGPAKGLQLRIAHGIFVWFCNAAIVVFPASCALITILGLLGVLPADRLALR